MVMASAYGYGAAAAALALNLTASVLSVYFGDASEGIIGPAQTCSVMHGNSSACHSLDERRLKLIFGDLHGLQPQPEQPAGSIVIFGARGGDDKSDKSEHRGDTIPMCNSIIELGWSCLPLFYSDEVHQDLLSLASGADGYISRVNPDVYEGVSIGKYEELLEELGNIGLAAMPHPRFMQRFGSKEALARISNLRTGLVDTVTPDPLFTGPLRLAPLRTCPGTPLFLPLAYLVSLYMSAVFLPSTVQRLFCLALPRYKKEQHT